MAVRVSSSFWHIRYTSFCLAQISFSFVDSRMMSSGERGIRVHQRTGTITLGGQILAKRSIRGPWSPWDRGGFNGNKVTRASFQSVGHGDDAVMFSQTLCPGAETKEVSIKSPQSFVLVIGCVNPQVHKYSR